MVEGLLTAVYRVDVSEIQFTLTDLPDHWHALVVSERTNEHAVVTGALRSHG